MTISRKFVAFKVQGFAHWIWFESSKVETKDGRVVGREGWGHRGELTDLDVPEDLVLGTIESNIPQYGS